MSDVRVMVDELQRWGAGHGPFHGRPSSHLTVNGSSPAHLDELHRVAEAAGLKREWFQGEAGTPHYDLLERPRAKALAAGAVFVPAREQAMARLAARKNSPGTVPGQTVEGESQGASTPAAVERGDDDEGQENSTDAPGNRGTAISDAHLDHILRSAKYTDDPEACEAVRKRLFGGGT